MKKQNLLESMLCLLMAMVCNVAWADFNQKWTKSPVGPWGTTDVTDYPSGVATNVTTAGGTVRKAEQAVTMKTAGNATISFTYVDGGHKLNILGVDLVNASGAVVASDYTYRTAGGDKVAQRYTLSNVPVGSYTLRYYVCHASKDNDQLNSTRGNIDVTGLDLAGIVYNVSDGAYTDRTDGKTSQWHPGWTSTNANKPALNISTNANNANAYSTEYIGLRPGNNGCTYTITSGYSDYQIVGFSFEAVNTSNSSETHVITINGVQKAVGTDWTTFTVDNVNNKTATFQLGGNNKKNDYDCYIRNVKVLLKQVGTATDFINGEVYTFITERGWMGATAENDKVISTARTSVNAEDKTPSNAYFQWTVYKSNNGNYYLYNLGKKQFMGVQTANNTDIDFVDTPAGRKLTFKQSSSANYPIMFSTDNAGVVNHSTNHGGGLVNWTGGWNTLNDGGSNHQVTLVKTLPEDELATIANLVEAYDKAMLIKVEVEGLEEGNPNTHFGSVRATLDGVATMTKLTLKNMEVGYAGYNNVGDVIDFTREYRGFEFLGYWLGDNELGKSFTLTEEHVATITADTPLVAKFKTTDEATLFYDDDPFSYRIPAIAKTSTGRLIAVSDYRYSLDDIGRYNFGTANPGIDLVMRYSDNNGATWSETKTIAKGSCVRGTDNCAYGDAAIAVVGNKVLVMGAAGDVVFNGGTATNHNRTVRIISEDGGENWTEPEDISETLFIGDDATIQNSYTAFFGSGLLAVDENYNDTDNARIYGAMLIKKEGVGNAIYVIYTDDFGLTWNILGGSQTPVTTNDEPKVEILPSGQILLSVRRNGGRQFNVFTYSNKDTNEGSWNGNVNGCSNGGSNTCNGEIYCIDAQKADGTMTKLLLQSQPKGGSGLYDRRDVTIWYKEISEAQYTSQQIASDWIEGLQVSTQQSAYSTMVMQNDGKIAFFFEEAPCYGDDQAKGYSMVYMPLSIENITKGRYFSKDTDLTAERGINVVLTDAQGNEYCDQVQSSLAGIAAAISAKYTFITLGNEANLNYDKGCYTYTNTVTLPFKVSNANTTVWHNIYWHGNNNNELVYLYGGAIDDEFVAKVAPGSNIPYGDSDYNTVEKADNMSWAIYHAGNFTFTLKNKLTGKYIKVTSVATNSNNGGKVQNAAFVEEGATAFEMVTKVAGQNYKGDYSFKATIDGTVGYLCNTSASYGWATHYTGNAHQGGWATIVEAPDFDALFTEVNNVLSLIGKKLGQYTVSEANTTITETAKSAMQNANTVKLNDLNTYKGLLNGATLNRPVAGRQFFRIRGISGNYVDAASIYNNANATTGQMSMKSAEECNYNGTIFYLDSDGHLLNYATGTYVKQTCEIGAVGDAKGVWTISESPRTGQSKYALSCTTTDNAGANLHDNSGNRADRCSSNCGNRHDFTLEEVTELPVTIGTTGYASFYTPVTVTVPAEVTAYYVESTTENSAQLTEIKNKVIPAKTGVLLYHGDAEAKTHNFAIGGTADALTDNMLEGTVAKTYVQGEAYVLSAPDGAVGLYKAKLTNGQFLNNAFKAYLPASAVASNVRFFLFDFGGEETGIEENINGNVETENTPVYDLSGRRVQNAKKGVFVVNGKVVVK